MSLCFAPRVHCKLDRLTSQARSVRGHVSRRAMHASGDSPWHSSAKHHILEACFFRMTPFRSMLLTLQSGLQSNWLRVLATAEASQVAQRRGQQLHPRGPLRETFTSAQQALARVVPRQGALDAHASRRDRGVAEPLAAALGALTVAGILWDMGDQARREKALAVGARSKFPANM